MGHLKQQVADFISFLFMAQGIHQVQIDLFDQQSREILISSRSVNAPPFSTTLRPLTFIPSDAIGTLVCNVDLPTASLLCDDSSFAFHSYCQTAYGLDSATENRPISHLATGKYKVYP